MTDENTDVIKIAIEIGDHHRGISVVGETKVETVKNLTSQFDNSKQKRQTCSRTKGGVEIIC